MQQGMQNKSDKTNNDFLLVRAKLKSTYQTLEVSSLYSSSSSLFACLAWAVFAGYGRFAREGKVGRWR